MDGSNFLTQTTTYANTKPFTAIACPDPYHHGYSVHLPWPRSICGGGEWSLDNRLQKK